MIQKRKTAPSTRAVGHRNKPPSKATEARRALRAHRPLHRHIALHPINIFALLCVGVLLVTFTLNAVADSYIVTAVVPPRLYRSPRS
jgi:hypothetical protein